jgi:hypothetical protein
VSGAWLEAVFRFSDNQSDVVEVTLPGTGIEGGPSHEDDDALIASVSPNPFGLRTTIEFHVPAEEELVAAVYDARGALVRRLVNHRAPSGRVTLAWYGRDESGHHVGSGIYFLRAELGGLTEVRKIVKLR